MLAGVMAGAQANPLSTSQAIDASQPNIIFVLVDDMILGMMDDLPRLRSLTSYSGMSFT
jgi:hypothetical protein